MTNFLPWLGSPAGLLYIFLAISQVAIGLYSAGQIDPPPGFAALNGAGLLWIVGWWLMTDSRKRGITHVYDIGYFLYAAWPIIMPYYLIKTRGAKAVRPILAFIAVYIGARLAGMGLYLLLGLLNG